MAGKVGNLVIRRPDDLHLHLRDGRSLCDVAGFSARVFGRAVVMPNLGPPILTLADARAYRDRILAALPAATPFTPLMTLYLTDDTDPAEVLAAAASGVVVACKLYPAGATTRSDRGVTDPGRIDDVLAAMSEATVPLLVHGEVTAPEIDIFDREAAFLGRDLPDLLRRHARLRVVLEHITTAGAARFVAEGPDRLAATITAHHLLASRNTMLAGGIRPHLYCLPILKRESDRRALLRAATSRSPKFFLGTDSAPHPVSRKESACGCAGIFTAHAALELYAEAFDEAGALDRLEAFASVFGARFYGLPPNDAALTLVREEVAVPETLAFGDGRLRPYRAGETLGWRIAPR